MSDCRSIQNRTFRLIMRARCGKRWSARFAKDSGILRNLASGAKHEKDTHGHQRSRGDCWHRIRPGGGGGVTVSGTASMGILAGEWIIDRGPNTIDSNGFHSTWGQEIEGQGEYELHTDIDVTFTMSGQTDAGLTFGASIDLDESDGEDDEGASAAFENRDQGGEEIFISGAFGTLTMGDTDGALDWAIKDIGLGSSLADAHTSHLGYVGNDFVDSEDGDGQIARYEYSFGDFAFGLSADFADEGGKDILAAGAKYSVRLPAMAMRLGVGVGWQQRAHDRNLFDQNGNPVAPAPQYGDPNVPFDGEVADAFGVSLDAEFDSGFRIVLNWADMGDGPEDFNYFGGEYNNLLPEEFAGIGVAYAMDDWTFAANFGRVSEGAPIYRLQEGYGLAVSYDLGGGAEVQLGYSHSRCAPYDIFNDTGGGVNVEAEETCAHDDPNATNDSSALSLGIAMKF